MAVREIVRMGHPVLRKAASPVDPARVGSAEFEALLGDMVDTLHFAGGIGLAAPQIDESLRLLIIEIDDSASRYGEIPLMPLTVFVNPVFTVLSQETAGNWEACLSVPGLRGYVERPQLIEVRYLDRNGRTQTARLEKFLATVFQHEFDHIEGRLYIDRIADTRLLSFEEEFTLFRDRFPLAESGGAPVMD